MNSDSTQEEPLNEIDEKDIEFCETADSTETEVDETEQLVLERDGYLNDLQRVTAEFSNFRKQSAKRNTEVNSRSQAELVEKLLPVLDACDLAVEHGANDVAPIREALISAFESSGLQVIDPLDLNFDPTCHEAVLHESA